jgi:hypothetical protein
MSRVGFLGLPLCQTKHDYRHSPPGLKSAIDNTNNLSSGTSAFHLDFLYFGMGQGSFGFLPVKLQ